MRGVLGIVGVVDNDGDDDVVVVVVVMERRKHCCCCCCSPQEKVWWGKGRVFGDGDDDMGQQVGKNTRIKLR